MKRTTLVLLVLFLSFTTISQTTNAFRVNYNQALFDLPGNAVEALTASNYVFAGTNLNFLPIYGTVTQVDDIGNLVWSKRYYDGSIGFQLNDIKKDASLNEYYLCGGSESNAAVFMRIDATGNLVVSKKFSITQADGAYFNRVIKTSDGGYVAVGYVIGYDPDGAGPEIDFSPINYIDSNGDPQTEYIGSPLIVKMNANGDHVWHKVFRYYTNAAKDPATHRIYNDAAFNDVVEVADGYVAVGQYDVNQHLSATNSDGDDATPTDAIILKTTTAGAITYHKQFDAVSSSTTQSSKYLNAANKTSAGAPIAAGGADNGKEWIIKHEASGSWALTFSRLFTYSSSFFGIDPVDISQIYEVNGGTDLVTMGMYIKPLSFIFSNSLHRINATASSNVWAKYYTYSMAALLPRGQQTSDNGFIMTSLTTGATDYDYHVLKTDPSGDTPLSTCPPTSFTPSAAAGPTTIADPYYNSWSGTVGPQAIGVLVTAITPTQSVQCTYTACTPPTISAQPINTTVCSTGSGALNVTASAGPYQWQYNNGGTWQNVVNGTPAGFTYSGATTNSLGITTSGATAGTYQFQVIVGTAPCTATSTAATITVPGATQLAPLGDQCSGITLNFTSTPTGATYAWTVTPPAGTSATPTSGSSQNFSYTPTNLTGSNQVFTTTVNVTYGGTTCPITFNNTIYPQPTAPVVGTITQPTCSVSTGSVALSGLPSSGTWTVTASPGGATTTGSGTTTTFSGLTANNTYTFTVTNASGCTSTASTSAAINPAPSVPTAPIVGTITQPTCSVATGSVALSGLPASGTWTVTAAPGGATITGSGTTGNFTGLSAGTTYTFTVTNASGCTSTASSNAVIDPQPTTPTTPIVGTITQPTCSVATGSVALSGLPSSGTWTVTASPGGATTTGSGTSTTFSGLTAGATYTFTVTNAGGCTSTASTSAAINTAPTVPTAPVVGTITQPTCASPTGSVALSGLPASGTWTVTAAPGGATITGSGTTGNFTGLSQGTTYTFTVTNNQGCTSVASANAIIDPVPGSPSAPIVGTITQPTCSVATGSVALSGLPSSGTWTVTASPGGATITGSGTTGNFTGLSAGTTYTYTVTNNLGCTSSTSTNAVINPQPITPTAPILGTITQPSCTVSTGSVDLSGLPSSGTWTVTASPGGATTTGSGTSTTFSGLTAGATYTFTVTNADGCTSTASTSAAINTAPTVPTAPVIGTITQPTCASPTGSVALSGLPASGTWTVTANPGGATITGSGTTGNFSGLTPGTTYTFTVTNDQGCTSVVSANAVIDPLTSNPPQPTGVITQNPTCAVPTGSIDVSTPTGANYSYSIDGVNFQTGTSFTGLAPGSYTITVLDNTTGCTSQSATTIDILPSSDMPVISLVAQVNLDCFGDSDGSLSVAVTGGTGPYTYAWTPNAGSGATISNLSVGTYNLVVTDDVGCSSNSSYTITAPDQLQVVGSITDVACGSASGGSISTTVTGGVGPFDYLWSPNGEVSSGLSDLAVGTYSLVVTDDNGCTATTSFDVQTNGYLGVDVTPDYSLIEAGTSVQLVATGASSYIWTPSTGLSCDDCPDPIASPSVTTTYIVSGTDEYGCFGMDTALVQIELQCGDLFVPTMFSPNGSGPSANELLCVFGGCIIELDFKIYNRWGELVFETSTSSDGITMNEEICWDGMHRGKLVQSGTYVYTMRAELYNGDIVEESGNITVVK